MLEVDVPGWLISFFTTLLAAFFGSLVAVNKFKKEILWKEKYKAYQDILSALEVMVFWANETYCYEKLIPAKGTHTGSEEKWISFSDARRIIAKSTCVGQLLLSEEVVSELKSLESELWNENFRVDDERDYHPNTHEESEASATHAKNIDDLVSSRLKIIIELARKDLV